jgi:DNA-damage-inducible protein J
MSDVAFNAVLNDVDSFSYNQCVMLLSRLTQVLRNWTSKDDSEDLFYSKSNIEHLERGIKALNEGKGVEHELIEVD